jgi:hypothetical protein
MVIQFYLQICHSHKQGGGNDALGRRVRQVSGRRLPVANQPVQRVPLRLGTLQYSILSYIMMPINFYKIYRSNCEVLCKKLVKKLFRIFIYIYLFFIDI